MSKYKFKDLRGFSDCSALTGKGKCTRLSVVNCQGQECPFRRTREEDIDSIHYTFQRLSSLDSLIQSRIADKYYRGLMPWKEAESNINAKI